MVVLGGLRFLSILTYQFSRISNKYQFSFRIQHAHFISEMSRCEKENTSNLSAQGEEYQDIEGLPSLECAAKWLPKWLGCEPRLIVLSLDS